MQQPSRFDTIAKRIAAFAAERDWEQFHSPKNLTMAIAIEAAELMENFLWDEEGVGQSVREDRKHAVAHEIADVLIYLIRLGQVTQIDLLNAVEERLVLNAQKYPADKVPASTMVATGASAPAPPNAPSGASYDPPLTQCAQFGHDHQGGAARSYFVNKCSVPISIQFYQPSAGSGTTTECDPGQTCEISVFGMGFTGNNMAYAACPAGDRAVLANGNSWEGTGTFYCRR